MLGTPVDNTLSDAGNKDIMTQAKTRIKANTASSKTDTQPTASRRATATKSQTTSTREQLTSIIKSARDLMRKDAGLSGDLDRLPQLSWVQTQAELDTLLTSVLDKAFKGEL